MTDGQSKQIEELLLTWYDWQIRQSLAEVERHRSHESRTCREYVTPAGADDDEIVYQWADSRQSEQVQLCIDLLPIEQRAAISVSMRNKVCGRNVWSSCRAGDQHATYQAAKDTLLRMFLSRHMIRVGEAA
jgi:hypothetical protein